ncbi:MAG: tRNA (adenosine(37)-N6)-threonylcarbamoyltransferase complex dimerization subunit type 1 TsaB, partial [Mycobacteriales bacterium]
MFVLAIDTATPAVSVGVIELSADGEEARAVATRVSVDARRHVEAVIPQVKECLAASGLTPADLTAVAVGAGPGPFTGLRVGMATAAAYADASNLPLYSVCSLDAVAYATRTTEPALPDLLVATDARRKEVYWAVYGPDGARLTEPSVDKPARLRELLDAGQVRASTASGEGAERYADELGLEVRGEGYPSCEGLVYGARERIVSSAPTEAPRPLYLR